MQVNVSNSTIFSIKKILLEQPGNMSRSSFLAACIEIWSRWGYKRLGPKGMPTGTYRTINVSFPDHIKKIFKYAREKRGLKSSFVCESAFLFMYPQYKENDNE